MDGSIIKQMLNNRIKDVCRHLLPNGKEERGEWSASNVNDVSSKGSSNTGSLRVSLHGSKVGQWIDHADTSQKGDIIALWMACRNVNFREALIECADFLNYKPVKATSFKKDFAPKQTPQARKVK